MENNRINVLYVIWSLALGGAERVVINLAKGLDRKKFHATVCCLNEEGPFAYELEQEGFEVIALHKTGPLDARVIGRIISIIRRKKIHLVHTHLWGANLWGRVAAVMAGVPVVCTEHSSDSWKSPLYLLIDRMLASWANKIIAVSESVKLFYRNRGIAADKMVVIPNGIFLQDYAFGADEAFVVRKELGLEKDAIGIAIIGRLSIEKGHRYLFDALKKTGTKRSIKVYVAGEGRLSNELQSYVATLGLSDKVVFLGLRKDIPRFLQGIDIVAMPSTREGLPIIALEAMAAAKPVVATDVGGNREVIIPFDGNNNNVATGMIVPAADVLRLAQAIESLADNAPLRKELGHNGHERVKQVFSLQKMVDDTQALYYEIMKDKAHVKK